MLSRLKDSNTSVLIRGQDLYQYKDIDVFLSQYFVKKECMQRFPPSDRHDFYGICAYQAKPVEETRYLTLPLWW